MLRVFKKIKETNLEAKKIIEEANTKAEKINREANQKALEAYNRVYYNIIEKTKKEATALKLKKEKDIEHELEKIKLQSEKTAKEIELKAKRNFEKAVEYVLNAIIGDI